MVTTTKQSIFVPATPTSTWVMPTSTPTTLKTIVALSPTSALKTTAALDTTAALVPTSVLDSTTILDTIAALTPTTAPDPTTAISTTISASIASDTALAPSPTVHKMSPFEVDSNSIGTTLICYGFLFVFIASVVALIVVDMCRKSKTGELRESIDTITGLGRGIAALPGRFCRMVLYKENWRALKRAMSKRNDKPAVAPLVPTRNIASEAIINRLASKGPGFKPKAVAAVAVAAVVVPEVEPEPAVTEPAGVEDGRQSPDSVYSGTYSVDASIIN